MNHETEGNTENTGADAVEPTGAAAAAEEPNRQEEAADAGGPPAPSVLFQAPDLEQIKSVSAPKRQERDSSEEAEDGGEVVAKRRRKRRRGSDDLEVTGGSEEDPPNTVTKVRGPRASEGQPSNKVASVKGSTRLEAKRQRRRDSRASGRRRHVITEAEFLARRESVERQMMVRQKDERIQIGVLEDGVLAEHFVSETQQDSLIGNVYVGKVQNVLPSMEAAFVDIGRGRNAVLYAGEVNWDASGLDGQPRKIENALKSGDSVLVQVTKDPIGHKGARLTSQISLPGRFLVYVPGGSMTGISRKLPDTERARLKKILKDKLPDGAGVIVRTAAEGAAEEELAHDINRLRAQWEEIEGKSKSTKVLAPELLYQEPDLTIKTVRDVFNEDFSSMVVQGDEAWDSIEAYVTYVAPDLIDRLEKWEGEEDLFDHYRIEEGLAKALERKVFLPSGGSLVIDRTEAMTVIDVNTGKFTGSGGNLEETVTKNNLEAAEEIVRQLRLRDIGGIIVIDFIDMVLESNRDLVLRRLVECLGRDRTKHQVAEVTSLGLVQMTRKRMGTGLLEVFSEPCEHCAGRGIVVQDQPIKGRTGGFASEQSHRGDRNERKRGRGRDRGQQRNGGEHRPQEDDARAEATRNAVASIAAASKHHEDSEEPSERPESEQRGPGGRGEQRHEDGESKSAKKRKRRKRNRNRQEGAQDEARPSGEDRSEISGPSDPDMVLTLHGELISLPQGQREDEEEGPEGEQGDFTLESLTEAFERRGEGRGSSGRGRSQEGVDRAAEEAPSAEEPTSGEEAPREAERPERERPAREESGDDAVAPRERRVTRESRLQARRGASERRSSAGAADRRAGREAAEAARRAALEAIEDMRPGRRSRPASSGEDRPARRAAGEDRNGRRASGEDRNGRRTGEDRAGRRASGGGNARRARVGGAPDPSDQPTVTGVATPGASSAAAPPEAEQAAPAQAAAGQAPAEQVRGEAAQAAPAPKRRRSRRAGSAGSGAEVVSGHGGTAHGASVTSTSAPARAEGSEEEVRMLGTGVKAEDIRRAE